MLVTRPPASDTDDASADWLIKKHAITVLPTVASLQSLRRHFRQKTAHHSIISFGNPLLDGDGNRASEDLSKAARKYQLCPVAQPKQPTKLAFSRSSAKASLTRSGAINIADVRSQPPLPDTADEVCAVAKALGVDTGPNSMSINLGARATEAKIKELNENSELADFRIIHFATHGLIAGQLKGTSEPGLILTPPAKASAIDNGYLGASEVAELKLNADWVILSACNTASGGANNAEALSGLARAFFYAGTRALLVSHWEVWSPAAVDLITQTVQRAANGGRAQALREAMLALIKTGDHRSRPEWWAPFVIVGEGTK